MCRETFCEHSSAAQHSTKAAREVRKNKQDWVTFERDSGQRASAAYGLPLARCRKGRVYLHAEPATQGWSLLAFWCGSPAAPVRTRPAQRCEKLCASLPFHAAVPAALADTLLH